MARQTNPETISLPTAVDLSAVNHRFVRWAPGAAGVSLCPGAMKADGVLVRADNANVAEVIVGNGKVKITAGAAIAIGGIVASDAQGRAVPNTFYAGEEILGRAEQAATLAGQVITLDYFGSSGTGIDRATI